MDFTCGDTISVFKINAVILVIFFTTGNTWLCQENSKWHIHFIALFTMKWNRHEFA